MSRPPREGLEDENVERAGEEIGASHGRAVRVPLHLPDDPGLADPAVEGAEAFIRGILALARSGMIIVGADLARAAHALGTGLRIGERRFVLEALLSQEPEGTLSWLAAESRAWVARHETWGAGLRGGVIAAVWKKRAGDAAALLERLSQPAAEEKSVVSDSRR